MLLNCHRTAVRAFDGRRRYRTANAQRMAGYVIAACSQLTFGFISAKAPCGFAFQAQTCSS
jgi:hypothetical protein